MNSISTNPSSSFLSDLTPKTHLQKEIPSNTESTNLPANTQNNEINSDSSEITGKGGLLNITV